MTQFGYISLSGSYCHLMIGKKKICMYHTEKGGRVVPDHNKKTTILNISRVIKKKSFNSLCVLTFVENFKFKLNSIRGRGRGTNNKTNTFLT